jgi:hypothetical protein
MGTPKKGARKAERYEEPLQAAREEMVKRIEAINPVRFFLPLVRLFLWHLIIVW